MHILNLIKNAAKEELRYKANMLGGILALVTLYSLQFIFFDIISSLVPSEKENSNWLLIFFMSYALGSLLVNFFKSAITGFFWQLTRGRIDTLLVRPINLLVLMLLRWCEVYYVLTALLLLLICILSNKIDFYPFLVSAFNTGLYLFVMVVGVVSSITFLLALNSFSFITQRNLPVDYIHSSVFTFALLPATFYSNALLYFFVVALPMVVFASAALDALYNGITPFVSVYFSVVTVMFVCVVKVVYVLYNRFDSIGG